MILAIDPGAEMGVALFRPADGAPGPGHPVALLEDAGLIRLGRCKPRTEYARIRTGLGIMRPSGPVKFSKVVIEVPSWAGTYGKKRGQPASVAGLYRRIGAIGALAWAISYNHGLDPEIVFRRAPRTPKVTRHAAVAALLREAGIAIDFNENVYDAIWIGCDEIGWEREAG